MLNEIKILEKRSFMNMLSGWMKKWIKEWVNLSFQGFVHRNQLTISARVLGAFPVRVPTCFFLNWLISTKDWQDLVTNSVKLLTETPLLVFKPHKLYYVWSVGSCFHHGEVLGFRDIKLKGLYTWSAANSSSDKDRPVSGKCCVSLTFTSLWRNERINLGGKS